MLYSVIVYVIAGYFLTENTYVDQEERREKQREKWNGSQYCLSVTAKMHMHDAADNVKSIEDETEAIWRTFCARNHIPLHIKFWASPSKLQLAQQDCSLFHQ
ncbi:uncharacterized protein LOC129303741 [Prosopis cineraria]|uniref:uncharacterized protein LOC129303741 n=1 Tax=Prosopis cineraria TaxID=364024 RepID=UPI00240F1E6B|nr:uncharacterized protein LOC129303741 [Prosopis cineraria]